MLKLIYFRIIKNTDLFFEIYLNFYKLDVLEKEVCKHKTKIQ